MYDENILDDQKERYIKALENFETYMEKKKSKFTVHRDEVKSEEIIQIISMGRFLQTSINLDAIAIVAKTEDETVSIKSEGYEKFEVHLSSLQPREGEEGTSEALTRGVTSKFKRRRI
mgnify:CR=1 FL=1